MFAAFLTILSAAMPLAAHAQERSAPDPAAMTAWEARNFEAAAKSFEASITACEAAEGPAIACMDLYLMRLYAARELGQEAVRKSLLAKIGALIEQGGALPFERVGHAQEEARYLHSIGDFAGAARAAERWIAFARDIGTEARWDLYWALDSAAWIYRELGQSDKAIAVRESLVELAQRLADEDPYAPVRAQFNLARFHFWNEQYDLADRAFAAAQASADGLAPEQITFELGWSAVYRSITLLVASEEAQSDAQFAAMLDRFNAAPDTLDKAALFQFYRETATISYDINPVMLERLLVMVDTLFADDIELRAVYRLVRAHQLVVGGKWDEVAAFYRDAISLYRENGDISEERDTRQKLANWMVVAKRYDAALDALDAIEGGDVETQLRRARTRGDALAGLDRNDEAEQSYRKAIALERQLAASGQCSQGYAQRTGKCLDEADYVSLFEPFQPRVVDLRLSLARAVERQGRLGDAEALRREIDTDPPIGFTDAESAQNRLALAINLDMQHRYDQAAAIFETGIAGAEALDYKSSQALVGRYAEVAKRFDVNRTFAERSAVQARYQALYDAVNGRTLALSKEKDGKRVEPDFKAEAEAAAAEGNFGQAETLMRRHLQQWTLSRAMTLKNDPAADLADYDQILFDTRRMIGQYILSQGRSRDAEKWLRQLLTDLDGQGPGGSAVAMVGTLASRLLASALESQERAAEAEPIRRELVSVAQREAPGDLSRLLGEQLRLANNLARQQDFRRSAEVARTILLRLAGNEDALGSGAARLYVRISEIVNPGHEMPENEALLRRGIALYREHGNADSIAALEARLRLAGLLENSDRQAEAESLRADLLAAIEPMLAQGRGSAIAIYAELAGFERGPDREAMLRRVLRLRRATTPAGDLRIAKAQTDLAGFLRREGRTQEALELLSDARRNYVAAAAPEDLRRMISTATLAAILQQEQRYAAARTATREIVAGALDRQQRRNFDEEARSELNFFAPSFRQLVEIDWELAQQAAD